MNKHEATEIGIRLIAILGLTSLVSTVPALLVFVDVAVNTNSNFYMSLGAVVFGIVTSLLISLVLWFNAPAISKWLWRNNQTVETSKFLTPTQTQIVLFTSIGLYIFLSSLPDLLEFFFYLGQKLVGSSQFVSSSDFALAAGYIIQVIISIWLIFDSDGIVKALQDRQRNRSK